VLTSAAQVQKSLGDKEKAGAYLERARSLKREPGIWSGMAHLAWHGLTKGYLKIYHRLRIEGAKHLPAEPPFILIANHSSHLDAVILGSALSRRVCGRVFPVAAGDVFFETPALSLLSAQILNALPMWRKNCGPHALAELKQRLVEEPCGYILFPEGARSRDGSLKPFKAGLGMIVPGGEAYITFKPNLIDDRGRIDDEATREFLQDFVSRFAALVARHARPAAHVAA